MANNRLHAMARTPTRCGGQWVIFGIICAAAFSHSCSTTKVQNANGEAERLWSLESKTVVLPRSLFSGKAWDWDVLSDARLDVLLRRRMPAANQIHAAASEFDALEHATGKTILWVPELTQEEREHVTPYRQLIDGRDQPLTVGQFLDQFLTMSTEGGFHLGSIAQEYPLEDRINVCIVTEKHIVFVALPAE